jgi:hypothetical protein
MTTAQINSKFDPKTASPRGCVAFPALDALRSCLSWLRRLLQTVTVSRLNLARVERAQAQPSMQIELVSH